MLPAPAPSVDVVELADEKVNLLVRAWTLPADFFPVRLELTRHFKERLDAEGIVIPMPQRELHIPLREPERRSRSSEAARAGASSCATGSSASFGSLRRTFGTRLTRLPSG